MQEKIQRILEEWFQHEVGNRVTVNNFQMLVIRINDSFTQGQEAQENLNKE
jgi:hypothetical protein